MAPISDWKPLHRNPTQNPTQNPTAATTAKEPRIHIHASPASQAPFTPQAIFTPQASTAAAALQPGTASAAAFIPSTPSVPFTYHPASVLADEAELRVLLGNDLQKGRGWEAESAVIRFVSPDGQTFSMNMEQLSTHLLLLGGIGNGKTTVFNQIIEPLRRNMRPEDVMVILDTKGDFYEKFYRPGDVVIGNSNQYEHVSSVWNIYGEVMGRMPQSGEPYRYQRKWDVNVKEIMKTLFKDRRSASQPFFADAAADLIATKIISDLREGDLSKMHTHKLKEFFMSAQVEDYDRYVLNPANRDFASRKEYYGDGTSPQALAVFAYINSMVSDCMIGVFGDEEGSGREFAMRDLVRRKGRRVIFVEYDLSVGEILGPMYRLLYDQALKEALGRSANDSGRETGNVFLICDEVRVAGQLSHLENALNYGRSLGVKVIAGLQSVDQIYDIYGTEKGKVILSGFSNMFCFRTGDAETRQFISEHFGKNYSNVNYWIDGADRPPVQREGHVVESWDVQRLERGMAIVDLWSPKPHHPFVFRFPDYRRGLS